MSFFVSSWLFLCRLKIYICFKAFARELSWAAFHLIWNSNYCGCPASERESEGGDGREVRKWFEGEGHRGKEKELCEEPTRVERPAGDLLKVLDKKWFVMPGAKFTDLSPAGLSTTTGHSCSSSKESIFVGCRKGSLKKNLVMTSKLSPVNTCYPKSLSLPCNGLIALRGCVWHWRLDLLELDLVF